MANTTTHVIRGTVHWAKVLGQPRMNTFTEEREWSVDLTPNEAGRAEIKRLGITDKLKMPKGNDKRSEAFISFRHREFKKDGGKNDPLSIKNAQGEDWDGGDIGNESVCDIKFNLTDNGKGRPKGVYIKAIRVLDHVEFKREEFAPLSADDEYFSQGNSSASPAAPSGSTSPADVIDGEMDDDIPF